MSSGQAPADHGAPPHCSASRLILALCAAFAADLALIAAGAAGKASAGALLGAHVLLGPAVWFAASQSSDAALRCVALAAVTVLGPAGSLGTILLAALLALPGRQKSQVRSWHNAISAPSGSDLSQRLSEGISEGRLFEPGRQSAAGSFQEIADTGSVRQRYAMLGLISQRFDPRFTPALQQALKSEVSAVRVSAAAVFSKLRDKNRLQMMEGQTDSDLLTAEEAQAHGMILARGVASGLLDPGDLAAARGKCLGLLLAARPSATVADKLEETISTLLWQSGCEREMETRLSRIDLKASRILLQLMAQMNMRAGHHDKLPEIIRPQSGGAVRLNSMRSSGRLRPLLSPAHGEFK